MQSPICTIHPISPTLSLPVSATFLNSLRHNNKSNIMTDEELRKFCLEQAVLISINKKPLNEFGRISESISLFDLSNMIFQYIKSGAKPIAKISVSID